MFKFKTLLNSNNDNIVSYKSSLITRPTLQSTYYSCCCFKKLLLQRELLDNNKSNDWPISRWTCIWHCLNYFLNSPWGFARVVADEIIIFFVEVVVAASLWQRGWKLTWNHVNTTQWREILSHPFSFSHYFVEIKPHSFVRWPKHFPQLYNCLQLWHWNYCLWERVHKYPWVFLGYNYS